MSLQSYYCQECDEFHSLIILPHQKFEDAEFQITHTALIDAGIDTTIASSSLESAEGMHGLSVQPDALIQNITWIDFQAILLIGGVGCREYWHNKPLHQLLLSADKRNQLLAAICLAPVTLANSGILDGRHATGYPSSERYLTWKGAIYTGNPVEIEENVITANGPAAAEEFAATVIKSLTATNYFSPK